MRAVAKIDDKQIADMDLDITFRMKVSEWRGFAKRTGKSEAWMDCALATYVDRILTHVTKSTETVFCEPLHEADMP